jgi:hypothetical protein
MTTNVSDLAAEYRYLISCHLTLLLNAHWLGNPVQPEVIALFKEEYRRVVPC